MLVAYETILTEKNHRRRPASRTRQMIKKYGIIKTAEKVVDRTIDPTGYTLLAEKGLENLTFEAVIDKYPAEFNREAIIKARERLSKYKS